MNFNFTTNEFLGIRIIAPKLFKDNRGFFYETYKASDFHAAGIIDNFVQDNQSYSHRNVLRGLHFQVGQNQQAKLVRCISGEIYDVAVDLRKSSPTFGKFFGINLSAQNGLMFYIPQGFAHGFSVLSEVAEVSYKVSAEYDPKSEFGVRWDDPDLAIDWKIKNPLVSEKDQALPFLKDLKTFF
jgi:dTDP-4-dehydrorhamnose 3,5-epimerase